MSLFQIRKTNDYDLISQLNSCIFPEDSLEIKKQTHAWIVWVKGDAVGFCTLDLFGKHYAFHSRAGLMSEARGFNLQKRMLSVRERYAKRAGCKAVITYTLIDNIYSIANLQNMKYKIYIPEYQYVGGDCLYWIKNL